MPHTVIDFWRMVYEHGCGSIVMLNPMDDNDEVLYTVTITAEATALRVSQLAFSTLVICDFHIIFVVICNIADIFLLIYDLTPPPLTISIIVRLTFVRQNIQIWTGKKYKHPPYIQLFKASFYFISKYMNAQS